MKEEKENSENCYDWSRERKAEAKAAEKHGVCTRLDVFCSLLSFSYVWTVKKNPYINPGIDVKRTRVWKRSIHHLW